MDELTPPWVTDEVRRAQVFIDQAWAEHVHDTEHAIEPDWHSLPGDLAYNSLRGAIIARIDCRYCRIGALTESLREWYEQQQHPEHPQHDSDGR